MKLTEVVSSIEVLTALDPEELGLRLLPWIASFPASNHQLAYAMREASEELPSRGREGGLMAIREAWAWLEGAALLIPSTQYVGGGVTVLSRRAAMLAKDPDPKKAYNARHLPKDSLHPESARMCGRSITVGSTTRPSLKR